MNINLELIERFHEKWVLSDNGCWEWQAATAGLGYGVIRIPRTRRQEYAHRMSYLIHHGELDKKEEVCHSCDNPLCVKPSHLFKGSSKDNSQDMKSKSRHLFGELNGASKLTDDKVRQIHKLVEQGVSQGKVARSYGIAQSTVHKILRGQRWERIYLEMKGAGQE